MISQRWAQVKSIFEAALERPVEERVEFVAHLCSHEEDLKAEVMALLAADRAMGSFMDRPASPYPCSNIQDYACLQVGEVLSERFQIVRFLGQGGMGRVYEALDLELQEPLAVKTIRPEIAADPRTVEQFIHEIQLSRKVTHPNVCRIFDLERDGSVLFLTMELLKGETLEDFLEREGALEVPRALPLVQQMSAALISIHECDVVHRDFKPGNVLLVQSKAGHRAVVTDFGLARPQMLTMAAEAGSGTSISSTCAGTPAYMAPEQLAGKAATPATDIYAFGLVIYKMVTGRLPFPTDLDFRSLKGRAGQLPPSPKEYVPQLDLAWERTIMRCLQADPASRFQRVTELVAELPGALPGGAIIHSPKSVPSKSRRLLLRVGWTTGLLSLALLLAAAGSMLLRKNPMVPAGPVELTPITTDSGLTWSPALSSGGDVLAYSSDRDGPGNLRIWAQQGNAAPKPVTHDSSDDNNPALSPDGKLIAYRSTRNGGGIYVSTVDGTHERLLAPFGRNPKFSPDGSKIVYWVGEEHNLEDVLQARAQMFTIPVEGGTPAPFHPEFVDARYPVWSADGKYILFQGSPSWGPAYQDVWDWWVASANNSSIVATRAFKKLMLEGFIPYGCPFYWSPQGLIFGARKSFGTSLWQLSLNSEFQAVGEPRRLTAGIEDDILPWVSPDGKLVLASTKATVNIWSGLPGTEGVLTNLKQITTSGSVESRLTVSNDGALIAFRRRTGLVEQIVLKDRLSGNERIVPIPSGSAPVIGSHGPEIAYSAVVGDKRPLYLFRLSDGASTKICDDCGDLKDLSADGKYAIYGISNKKIGVLDIDTGQRTGLSSSDGSDLEQPRFSADGRWIAVVSTADEQHSQIRIVRFVSGRTMDSKFGSTVTAGGSCDLRPTWSSDGSTLFFYSNRDGFYCVWRINLDPNGKHPLGPPVPVKHFHYARVSPMHLSRDSMGLAYGGKTLFFNLCELTGNIFTAQLTNN